MKTSKVAGISVCGFRNSMHQRFLYSIRQSDVHKEKMETAKKITRGSNPRMEHILKKSLTNFLNWL